MSVSTASEDRFISIDAVRGFAVMGILIMNIVSMGLPVGAYSDPTAYGGSTGANLWTWAAAFVFADGKMRALFTMLFGASMVLISDRAERGSRLGPIQTHYRRAFWLLIIGIAHSLFLWIGDILVFYAVAGAIVFPLRRLRPQVLLALGLAIYIALLGYELTIVAQMHELHAAAMAPGASATAIADWNEAARFGPPPEVNQGMLKAFRGSFVDALNVRTDTLVIRHTRVSLSEYPEAVGLMLLGMGLFRLGFFTLKWPTRTYLAIMGIGYLLALPATVFLVWRIIDSGLNGAVNYEMSTWSMVPRLFLAMAYASTIQLIVRAGWLSGLIGRIAATGRMALSNYLGTSLVTSILFCGYGFGLYGDLQRWQLYIVVLALWAVMLLWSKPWLARFRYGPMEWVWRSLVQWRPQPMLRPQVRLAAA